MNSFLIRSCLIATLLMAITSIAMQFLPSKRSEQSNVDSFDLEVIVPRSFGEWRHDPSSMTQMVNPQTKAMLDKIYSQILTRTYVNDSGHRIMLSIAYGSDQRGALQAHKPEICYPAQGFTVSSPLPGSLKLAESNELAVYRMMATRGVRFEPVTYWFTVGNQQVTSALMKRVAELKAVLTGQIPDGLLFRVSSTDRIAEIGFKRQDAFVNQLISALPPRDRSRLAGIELQ